MNWTPGMTLESVEKMAIVEAYRFYRGNKTQTASSLGIAIRTLDSKLEKYEADERERDRTNERLRAEKEEFIRRQRGLPSSDTGIRMESPAQVISESKVSMPERPQVQEMLQGQIAKSGKKRTSASI